MLADFVGSAVPPPWVFAAITVVGLTWVSLAAVELVVAVQPIRSFVCRLGHRRTRVVRAPNASSCRLEVYHCRECGQQHTREI